MNIQELIFIRDFKDLISDLDADILEIQTCVETDENRSLEVDVFFNSIRQRVRLLDNLMELFKEKIDKKYWDEWRKKYPHMPATYEESNP